MFDAIFGFSSTVSPLTDTARPSGSLAIDAFSMTPDPRLSAFPSAASASDSLTSLVPVNNPTPAEPKLDLGSNSPVGSSPLVPIEETVPAAPLNVTIVTLPVASETPENVGNPDPDLFFFPF